MVQPNEKKRPPKGTVRPKKVAEAKKKIFRLINDPVAITVTVDALLDELYPDNDPPQKGGLKIVSDPETKTQKRPTHLKCRALFFYLPPHQNWCGGGCAKPYLDLFIC